MEAKLKEELRKVRDREKDHKLKIAEQARKIRSLKAAISALIHDKADHNDSETEVASVKSETSVADQEDSKEDVKLTDDEDEDAHEDVEPEEPQAIWDSYDGLYRCAVCCFEVPFDRCHGLGCWRAYSIDHDDPWDDHFRSIVTDHASLNPDRRLAPRGDTPLREVPDPTDVPKIYANRRGEYHALLQRGATRDMCKHFELEFSDKKGIVAWADDDLFDAFSGPGMKEGDRWKIYLGRRIEVEEADFDGSEFIDSLLEEVLLFPLHVREEAHRSERWITTEEEPGIWATRPAVARDTDAQKTTRRVKRTDSELVDEDDYDTDMAEADAGYVTDLECASVRSWDPVYAATEGIRSKPKEEYDEEYDDYDEEQGQEQGQEVVEEDVVDAENEEGKEEEEEDNNPTISREVYETVDDDSDGEDELQEDTDQEAEALPLHVAWDAFTPDAEYDSEADEGFKTDSSSPDSDFDPQEELSGDEFVLRK